MHGTVPSNTIAFITRTQFLIVLFVLICSCSESIDSSVVSTEKLDGRWELIAVFKDGVQITDTLGTGELHSVKFAHVQRTFTLMTDSGLYIHVYKDEEFFRQSKVTRPRVIDFKKENGQWTSIEYFLIGNELTNEQKFTLFPYPFDILDDNGPVLHYSWVNKKVLEITNQKLILEFDGKEHHYMKIQNSG